MKDGLLTSAAIEQLPTTDHAFVNRTAILSLLQHMRVLCQRNEKTHLDFDDLQTQILTVYLCLDLVWTISKLFVTV